MMSPVCTAWPPIVTGASFRPLTMVAPDHVAPPSRERNESHIVNMGADVAVELWIRFIPSISWPLANAAVGGAALLFLSAARAAGDVDDLAAHEAGFVAHQKRDDIGDVFGFAGAANGGS